MAKTTSTTRANRRPELPAPTVAPAATATPETAATPEQPQRLAVPLTSDGNAIDWARMRDSTRAKFLEMARGDARLRETGASAAPVADVFNDAWCAMIYDALGSLEQTIVQRVYKVDAATAALWIYTDEDKRLLTGPTQRVLNKYASRWLTTKTDEVALLVTLATVHIAKLQQLRAVVESAAASRPHLVPMPGGEQ